MKLNFKRTLKLADGTWSAPITPRNPRPDPRNKVPISESRPGQELNPFGNEPPDQLPTIQFAPPNPALKQTSDEDLVKGLRIGNPDAKEELLARYFPIIQKQLQGLGLGGMVAEEEFPGVMKKVMEQVSNDFSNYNPQEGPFKNYVMNLTNHYGSQVLDNDISGDVISRAMSGDGSAKAQIMEKIEPLIRDELVNAGMEKEWWPQMVHDPRGYQDLITGERPAQGTMIDDVKLYVMNALKDYDPSVLPFNEFVKEIINKFIETESPSLYGEHGEAQELRPGLDYDENGIPINVPEYDERVKEVSKRLQSPEDKAIWDFAVQNVSVPGESDSLQKNIANYLNSKEIPNILGMPWTPTQVSSKLRAMQPTIQEVFNVDLKTPPKYVPPRRQSDPWYREEFDKDWYKDKFDIDEQGNPINIEKTEEKFVPEKPAMDPTDALKQHGWDTISSALSWRPHQEVNVPIWKARVNTPGVYPTFSELADQLNERGISRPKISPREPDIPWDYEAVKNQWYNEIMPIYERELQRTPKDRLEGKFPSELRNAIESESQMDPPIQEDNIEVINQAGDIEGLDIADITKGLEQIFGEPSDEEENLGDLGFDVRGKRLSLRKTADEQVLQNLSPVDQMIYTYSFEHGMQPTQIAELLMSQNVKTPRGGIYGVHEIADRLSKVINPMVNNSSPKGVIAKLSMR
jgi:hypothetical protein